MKIGAVLPLSIRGSYDIDDLGRIDILFRSLCAFTSPDLFGSFLIVTPPNETTIVQEKCQAWPQFNIRVLSEEALVPELTHHRHVRGWRKQQLVKLAAAREITEDFFITLDADVICLKAFTYDDIIVNGRAIIQYENRSQHPKWWASSSKILKMDPNVGDPSIGMTVTPAVLSKRLCLQLATELSSEKGNWVDYLCGLHNPKSLSNWTIGRFLRSKWTEYSLYYLCAMKHNMLDDFHIRCGTKETPQLLLIHDSHPFESWNPETSFSRSNPGLFCVVGSKSKLEPSVVWDKIQAFVPACSQ